MSHQTQARSRNAQHAIAVKQTKPQQTSNMRQSRTQPTNKQPSGHTATRAAKHPTKNKETPQPRLTGTATGHPDTAYATNATTPSNHTPTGSMFPSRAQCADHGPTTGGREPPRTHPNRVAPTQTTRRAAQTWPRQGKDKSPANAAWKRQRR